MSTTLDNIQDQITAIQDSITALNTLLNNLIADMDSNISSINAKIELLNDEKESIHLEIHLKLHNLASDVGTNDTRLKQIEVKNILALIDNVRDSIDVDVLQLITEMDVEHHNELHLLANNIDAHSTRLTKLELLGASIPKHIFVSESEYLKITPDIDKFYFTYED